MENTSVPYIVYESAQARAERHNKRLVIALVIAIVLIFASNGMWLLAWMQYDYSSEETVYTQDGEGINIIGDENHVADQTSAPQDANEEGWLPGDAQEKVTP